jgi:hypothetical protein
MGYSINLRGDLAKLSDAELASRLEQAWQDYDVAEGKLKPGRLWYSRRGPIRHPWAYRFLSIAGMSNGFRTYLGLGPLPRFAPLHFVFCEIHDLTEELERRVKQKQRTKR